jgi:mannan endo-1,4-beta-mannosidase
MKKKIYTLLCCCVGLLSVVACDDSNGETPIPTPPTPELVSSNPINGAINVPVGDLTIELTYDKNITVPSAGHSLISITNNATVKSIAASSTKATILVSGLEKEKTYTLSIPKGVILGPAKVEAPAVTISFTTIAEQHIASSLVVKNPSSQAVKLYAFLRENYGKKIISGTMAEVDWNITEAQKVYTATNKYPAMNTFDYIFLYASPAQGWIDYSNTQVVEDWWNNNGIVSACWHWNVPKSETSASNQVTFRPEETTFHPNKALIEGTWENTVMKADLSKLAGYLKLLRDKNIPVIWRPLHEAAGNIYEYQGGTAWFWWGRDGADAFKGLWRYMFNYFQEQGLNNLIWVWTTQTKDDAFYPGDEYVDIVGRDIYDQTSAVSNSAQFESISLQYPNKLITLSENGNVAKISEQWTKGARWSFFMPWYDNKKTTLAGHEYADTQWWIDAVGQSYVITRDEMPSLK